MTPSQRVRLHLAVRDIACAFGCWVLALLVALAPLVLTIILIRLAVQRWG